MNEITVDIWANIVCLWRPKEKHNSTRPLARFEHRDAVHATFGSQSADALTRSL